MWDLEARDHHPDADRLEHRHLCPADDLSDLREVRQDLRIDIEPVIHLESRHDECVARPQGPIGEECNGVIILPNEASGKLAGDDAAEHGRHEPRLILDACRTPSSS